MIELIKGPINEEMLTAITLLYGLIDPRYKDISFCKNIFNDNPCGYSFHAFAYYEEMIVGHCAVIPLEIVNKGEIVLSGKAEAFYLKEEYKRNTLDKKIPIGIALPLKLYNFAIENGLHIIHLIAADDVGNIHRLCGCEKLKLSGYIFYHFINNEYLNVSFEHLSRIGKIMIRILTTYQYIIYYLWRIIIATTKNKDNFSMISRDNEKELSLIARKNQIPKNKWSIRKDAIFLKWLMKYGIQIIKINKNNSDYVIIQNNYFSGYPLNIIEISIEDNKIMAYIKMLIFIIQKAREQKSSCIKISSFISANDNYKLFNMLKLVGFIKKKSDISLYIKSNNKYYIDINHIIFTPYFYNL